MRRLASSFLIIMGISLLLGQMILTFFVQPMKLASLTKEAYLVDADQILNNINNAADVPQDEVQELPSWVLPEDIDPSLIVGYIAIPTVALDLPILSGTTSKNLRSGATTMKSSQRMGIGNYALAGHLTQNASTLFSPLHRMKVGELIYLTDKVHVYHYRLESVTIVFPEEIGVLDDIKGLSLLTLVTCEDSAGKRRRVLVAKLIETTEFDASVHTMFNVR